MKPVFETQRLVLQPMQASHLDGLFEILSDPEAMRYFDVCRPMTRRETTAQLNNWIAHKQRHGFSPGLIVLKQTNCVIGYGGLAYYPETERDGPELIYIFKPAYWGQGLATEFAIATVSFALEALGLAQILATARPENKPSIRVLEKAGMRFEKCIPEINRYLYHIEKDRIGTSRTVEEKSPSVPL